MRRKWIPLLKIYLGSTDCDLDKKDYRLDGRGNGLDSWKNGSIVEDNLLHDKDYLLCVKDNLLHDKDYLLCVKDNLLRV
jgi:hypothetical protein